MKNLNQMCYHTACESVAKGESLTGHVNNDDNVAVVATKIIGADAKRVHLVSKLLHHMYV
jgi:acylphosphatase